MLIVKLIRLLVVCMVWHTGHQPGTSRSFEEAAGGRAEVRRKYTSPLNRDDPRPTTGLPQEEGTAGDGVSKRSRSSYRRRQKRRERREQQMGADLYDDMIANNTWDTLAAPSQPIQKGIIPMQLQSPADVWASDQGISRPKLWDASTSWRAPSSVSKSVVAPYHEKTRATVLPSYVAYVTAEGYTKDSSNLSLVMEPIDTYLHLTDDFRIGLTLGTLRNPILLQRVEPPTAPGYFCPQGYGFEWPYS
jgi:hypothetical protein